MNENLKVIQPFNIGYVLRITARHMRREIDRSIRKTFERVSEFAEDREKSEEVFYTLSILHQMRKNLDEFQSSNIEAFRGKAKNERT
jgi:hypothetical protein